MKSVGSIKSGVLNAPVVTWGNEKITPFEIVFYLGVVVVFLVANI